MAAVAGAICGIIVAVILKKEKVIRTRKTVNCKGYIEKSVSQNYHDLGHIFLHETEK